MMRSLQLNPRHILDPTIDRCFPRPRVAAQSVAFFDAAFAQVGALRARPIEEGGGEVEGQGHFGRAHAFAVARDDGFGRGGVLVEGFVED